jgi:hypothetical protein
MAKKRSPLNLPKINEKDKLFLIEMTYYDHFFDRCKLQFHTVYLLTVKFNRTMRSKQKASYKEP